MPTWPAGLPQKPLIPATDKPQDAVLRTPMDSGPSTTRNRFTAVSRNFSPTIQLTNAERQTFDTFFKTDLKNGALSFDWTDPVTEATVSMKFRATPDWQAMRGGYWQAQLELEILP